MFSKKITTHTKKTSKLVDLQMPHPKVNDKGKGVLVDQDGFQAVQHKNKGARRNIFGKQDNPTNQQGMNSEGTMFKYGHDISSLLGDTEVFTTNNTRIFSTPGPTVTTNQLSGNKSGIGREQVRQKDVGTLKGARPNAMGGGEGRKK